MLRVKNRNSNNSSRASSSSSNTIQHSTNDKMLVLVCSVCIYKIKTCVCSIDIASWALASIPICPPPPPPSALLSLHSFYHFLEISFISACCIHLNSKSTVAYNSFPQCTQHKAKQSMARQGKTMKREKTCYSGCKRLHQNMRIEKDSKIE